MSFFLLLNTKENILKIIGNQTVAGTIDFHIPFGSPTTVWLPTFFKISYFVFKWRKKSIQDQHMEQHKGESILGWTFPLNISKWTVSWHAAGMILHLLLSFQLMLDWRLHYRPSGFLSPINTSPRHFQSLMVSLISLAGHAHSWLRLNVPFFRPQMLVLHSCEGALMLYCGVYTTAALFIASPAPSPLANAQSDLPLERGRSVSSSQ